MQYKYFYTKRTVAKIRSFYHLKNLPNREATELTREVISKTR